MVEASQSAEPPEPAPSPEPTAPAALRLRGVRKSYPHGLGLARREVLHGIDLDLAQGDSLGLVGPNGSGKSTLLRLIAGVDRASAGALGVLGGTPASAEIRRRVGFCPEDSPFPRELRALAALELVATLHGVRRRDARPRGAELLERVGLGSHARTPLARFSRGMLRRFAIAQALVHAPDIVLLDEPTAGLDATGFSVLGELLSEARARGAALVVSSHLLGDLHRHCRRVAVLIGGSLVAQGAPSELLAGSGPRAIEVGGLDEAALAALEREVLALGGTWGGVRPSQDALVELYRRHARGAGENLP